MPDRTGDSPDALTIDDPPFEEIEARGRCARLRQGALAASLALAMVALAACGSSSTPQSTLGPFLTDWSRGDWTAMRTLVADPPADFASANAAAFSVLGVSSARFTAGRVTQSGSTASAGARALRLAAVGAWSPSTVVRLVKRNGRWLVAWTQATINPSLGVGDRLATSEIWPARAPILGAGGAPLTTQRQVVVVGIVGSGSRRARGGGDLIGAGATDPQVRAALAQAKAHPDYFEPVFTISQARFAQLKAQPGPANVYNVAGTQFQLPVAQCDNHAARRAPRRAPWGRSRPSSSSSSGPRTTPPAASDRPGWRPAGDDARRNPHDTHRRRQRGRHTVASWPSSRPGRARRVSTSIDPKVQRAAEAALATATQHNVAMVAINASTGQLLAVVSDPVSTPTTQRSRVRTHPARRSRC